MNDLDDIQKGLVGNSGIILRIKGLNFNKSTAFIFF